MTGNAQDHQVQAESSQSVLDSQQGVTRKRQPVDGCVEAESF